MWDYTAGRTAGLLAFELLLLCFLLSAVMQLYFKTSAANVVLLETAAVLLVLTRWVKPTKKLHPILFILASAVVGVVFSF